MYSAKQAPQMTLISPDFYSTVFHVYKIQSLLKQACLVSFLALIFSCTPQSKLGKREQGTFPASENQTLEYAQQLKQQAAAMEDPQKSELLTKALYIFVKINNIQEAESILYQIDSSKLDSNQQALLSLAKSDVFLFHGDEKNALSILDNQIDVSMLSLELQKLYSSLKANANFQNNDFIAGLKELIFISPMLDKTEKENNNKTIWQYLSHLTSEQINTALETESDSNLKAWLELSLINKTYQNNLELEVEQFKKWIEENPDHDARELVEKQIRLIRTAQKNSPKKIVFLLPETGPYAKSADAIRHGFLSNYYQSLNNQSIELVFFNTDDAALTKRFNNEAIQEQNPDSQANILEQGFLLTYEDAVATGGDLIIGPINKKYIDLINAKQIQEIPTLALNYSSAEKSEKQDLYQFGLAPEDEIDFITKQTALKNYKNAAILAPSGDWGDRLSQAFKDSWNKKGGKVVSSASYSDTRTLTKLIQKMLNIDSSNSRFRRLYWYSGGKVIFYARRRQDIDFIYLIGTPEMGRQIMPTFAFLDATDIPVFSNSTIYSGQHDPKDKDLNRLLFAEIPSMLNPDENAIDAWKSQDFRYRRLIAMGMDTYNLSLRLSIMKDSETNTLLGQTGTLYMNRENRIKRIPMLAKFYGSFVRPQVSLYH